MNPFLVYACSIPDLHASLWFGKSVKYTYYSRLVSDPLISRSTKVVFKV